MHCTEALPKTVQVIFVLVWCIRTDKLKAQNFNSCPRQVIWVSLILKVADLKLPGMYPSGPFHVEQATEKTYLFLSKKWFLERCFQTQQIKDRMDVITAVSFLSDKSLCLQLLKGKKKACKSPTRNELNELSFHMCNSFLTNHLLVVVVTREFPRWMILFIIVMKLGWAEGKWMFLKPHPSALPNYSWRDHLFLK